MHTCCTDPDTPAPPVPPALEWCVAWTPVDSDLEG